MIEIVNNLAEEYSDFFTSDEDELLIKISKETYRKHPKAHMISSKVQGTLLSFISTMKNPTNILEIGTFTGYSALCMAKGLKASGELHTIELRDVDAKTAQEYFNLSKRKNQIHLHLGDAHDIIPTFSNMWDLVFIDADKTGYVDYYELVVPRMAEGGLIIVDNVLFHGQVLEKPIKGKNAKSVHEFNRHVAKDYRTEQVLLPFRDGLLLIKRK